MTNGEPFVPAERFDLRLPDADHRDPFAHGVENLQLVAGLPAGLPLVFLGDGVDFFPSDCLFRHSSEALTCLRTLSRVTGGSFAKASRAATTEGWGARVFSADIGQHFGLARENVNRGSDSSTSDH